MLEIGGRRTAVLVLACAALFVAFFALDGPLTGRTTVEATRPVDEPLTSDDSASSSGAEGTSGDQDVAAPADEAQATAKAAGPALAVKVGDDPATGASTGDTTAGPETDTAETPTAEPATAETTIPDPDHGEETSTTAAGSSSGTKPVIHLTFDDGPSEITPRVMDLLEQYNGRATFFVMGSAVEDHPEIAREIVERGHAIANHSYDHMDWRQPGAREDAIRTQTIIEEAAGVTPSCARPPFGAEDENLLSILSSLGMESWRWDLSAEDHTEARHQVEQTLNTIDTTPNIRGAEGKIFLQHDSDLQLGPSIDGLEAWLAKNGDRYEFKAINGCLDYQ